VVHGKEPNHFLAMFGGRLVIFAGGKAGWGSRQQDEGPGDTHLLQVRGTAAFNTKAEQVSFYKRLSLGKILFHHCLVHC